MSTGLLDCLLNTQSKTTIPAGQRMQVVMIDREHLYRNPYNDKIYIIGDVSRLKEDIKANGIRQPLEVVRLNDDDYQLIGGERRLTACEELAKEGFAGYDRLPCVVRESKDADDDKIALITANATARDLTDGERLAQYEALKEILTRRKRFGQLDGKVRDELCRILGLSTGAAARLNAIAENCGDDTKRELRTGEITLMAAYRRAQDVIDAKKQPVEPPKKEESADKKKIIFDCEPKTAETVPQNPDYDEWNLPPECRVAIEKAHREADKSRGCGTLHMLAQKTLKDNAPWEMAWEDVRFGLVYYSQNLPGGAKLWKRLDENRKKANVFGADDYAIILQDNSFFTCGWVTCVGVVDELVRFFELK